MFLIMEIILEILLFIDDIVEGIIKTIDSPADINSNWDTILLIQLLVKLHGVFIILETINQ